MSSPILPKGFIGTNDGSPPYLDPWLSADDREIVLEQWKYLCCTVTGLSMNETIIGLPIRAYPRYLSEDEKHRCYEMQREKEEEGSKDDELEINPKVSDYHVYPKVRPPRVNVGQALKQAVARREGIRIPAIDIIVGPYISIEAYNDGAGGNERLGIKSQRERGSLDFDEQYNACTLQLFVKTTDGYKRGVVTNRLSFYINDVHGKRVFPENIESQLSLIAFRNSRGFYGNNKKLLAPYFRGIIPKILKSVISELVSNKNEIDHDRFESVLRTYLLVHQIGVKFVLYYQNLIYEYLFTEIFKFISNPFRYAKDWESLEELLITASLVNIPWSILRESFIIKYIDKIFNNLGDMRHDASITKKINHVFHQNKKSIIIVLLLISLNEVSVKRSLIELDKIYNKLWGSLPKNEKAEIRQQAQRIAKDLKSFADFWRMVGMCDIALDDEEVQAKISKYIEKRECNEEFYGKETTTSSFRVIIPGPNQTLNTVANTAGIGIVQYTEKRKRLVEEKMKVEFKKHAGVPPTISPLTCEYPNCHRTFNTRSELFRHLHRCIPDLRRNYHRNHAEYIMSGVENGVENELLNKSEVSPGLFECIVCHDSFGNISLMAEHYKIMNFPGNWETFINNNNVKGREGGGGEVKIERDFDPESRLCSICLECPKDIIFIPCGHLTTCNNCSKDIVKFSNHCPMCRGRINQTLKVYY